MLSIWEALGSILRTQGHWLVQSWSPCVCCWWKKRRAWRNDSACTLKPSFCKVRLRPCLKERQQGLESWFRSEGNLLLLQRTWLGFQHPLAGSWPPVTPVLETQHPVLSSSGSYTCGAHKFTRAHTHTLWFSFPEERDNFSLEKLFPKMFIVSLDSVKKQTTRAY